MNITNIVNIINIINSETGRNRCYMLGLFQHCYHTVKNNIDKSLLFEFLIGRKGTVSELPAVK
jgi:hypothetical protein